MNLLKLYSDPQFPGSYSGVDKFFLEVKKLYPRVTKKKVLQTLQKLDAYTLHKRATRPKTFRKTWTHAPKDLWQIDLLDLQKYKSENQGHRYLCVVKEELGGADSHSYLDEVLTKSSTEKAFIRRVEFLWGQNDALQDSSN